MAVTVLIVDDEPEWCDKIRERLEKQPNIKVVGVLHRAEEAVKTAPELNPDVILLDMFFGKGRMGGITAIKRLRASSVTSKILVFSAIGEEDKVYRALEAGANSYVWKKEGLEGIADAVVATSQGRAVCSPAIARKLERRLKFLLRRFYDVRLEEILRVKYKEVASASGESSLGR